MEGWQTSVYSYPPCQTPPKVHIFPENHQKNICNSLLTFKKIAMQQEAQNYGYKSAMKGQCALILSISTLQPHNDSQLEKWVKLAILSLLIIST
jgi:hypothetical protein